MIPLQLTSTEKRKFFLYLFLIATLVLPGMESMSQTAPPVEWQKTFTSPDTNYRVYSTRQTTDGGYIMAGIITPGTLTRGNMLAIKTDKDGNIQWQKSIGTNNGSEHAFDVQHTTDGGYILCGVTTGSNNSFLHGYIVKLDAAGNTQWDKIVGTGDTWYEFRSVSLTADGGYILAGYTRPVPPRPDTTNVFPPYVMEQYLIVKVNNVGVVEWQRSYGGSATEQATCVKQTGEGGYIVVGTAHSNDGDVMGQHGPGGSIYTGPGSGDIWVIKLTAGGSIQWQRCLGGTQFETGNSILETKNGGYMVAGTASSVNGDVTGLHGLVGTTDAWIIRLSPTGETEWQKTYGGVGDERATCIEETGDGEYVFVGSSTTFSAGGNITTIPAKTWIVKIKPANDISWQLALNEGYNNCIRPTSDNGYILSGETGLLETSTNILLTKLKGSLIHQWYIDEDGDGYGNPDIGISSENQPQGYVEDNTDCNDHDSEAHTAGAGHSIRFTNKESPKGWNCKDGKYTLNFHPGCGFTPTIIIAYHITAGIPEMKSVEDLKKLLIPKEYIKTGIDQIVLITDNIVESTVLEQIVKKIEEEFLKPNNISIGDINIKYMTKGDIPADGKLFDKDKLTPAFYSAVSLDLNLNWSFAGDPVLFELPDGFKTLETSNHKKASAFSCSDGGFTVTNKSENCWNLTGLVAINDNLYTDFDVSKYVYFGALIKDKEKFAEKVEEKIKRIMDWIQIKIPEKNKKWFTKEKADEVAGTLSAIINFIINNEVPENSFTFTGLPAGHYEVYGIEDSPWFVIGEATVEEPEELTISKLPNRSVLCSGEKIELGAPAGFIKYEWSNGETGNIITITEPGTYSVKVTTETGCVATLGPVVIRAATIEAPQIQSSGTAICPDKEATLGTTTGYESYKWNTGETTSTIKVHDNKPYTVTVTTTEGCNLTSEAFSITILEAPVPIIQNTGPLSFCPGGSVQLGTTTSFSSYVWSTGATSTEITATTKGNYSVTVTNSNGCTATSPLVTVSIFDPPAPVITGPASFCKGGTASLSVAGNFDSYTWSNGGTGNTITVNTGDTYTVTVKDNNGCTGTSSLTVAANDLPVPLITTDGPTELCPADDVILTASGGFNTYEWSNGAIGNSVIITSDKAGIYRVTVTDNNNCKGTSNPIEVKAGISCASLCYAMLATEQVNLSRSNVLQGGIGVIGAGNRAVIENNSHVDNNSTFVRADIIRVLSGSTIFSTLPDPLTITLPVFETNTTAGGSNINVPANAVVNLSNTIYRDITIGANARVTFTQSIVNIRNLNIGPGAIVNFAACTHVRIKQQLIMETRVKFNDANTEVVVFADGKIDIDMGSTVNVKCMYTHANLLVATSTPNLPNNMRGLFVARRIISGNYTNWIANCGASFCFNWVPNETSVGTATTGNTVTIQPLAKINTPEAGKEVWVWPNPANKQVNIRLNTLHTAGIAEIRLLDIDGRIVKRWRPATNNTVFTLPTHSLVNGLYILVIDDRNGKQQRKKIMVQH